MTDFGREIENLIASLRQLPEEEEAAIPSEQKRRMRNRVKPLASVLPDVLKAWSLDKPRLEETIMERWTQIVGEANAHRCRPEKVDAGILYVFTGNAVLANELRMNRRKILLRLHGIPDGKEIRDIRFS